MSPPPDAPIFREPRFFEIGYTGDDSFDQFHADYEVCFGCCHTQKSGKVISIISLCLALTALGLAIYFVHYPLVVVGSIYVCSSVSLIIAAFLERPRLILPYIVISVLRELFELYLIAKMGIGLTHALGVKDKVTGFEYLLLCFTTLLIAIHASVSFWIIWTTYIHYCYLRDRPTNFSWNGKLKKSWIYRIRRNFRFKTVRR